MDLKNYYRQNKDDIHSELMDIACELAAKKLMDNHNKTFEHFIENVSLREEDGSRYKKEYQDEFDNYYDELYTRIAKLFRFDVTRDDGFFND